MDNDIEEITVTPTTSDDGATVEYLDENDQTLTDADPAAGHQVSLDPGANTFKVKVTAEDGNTTQTYKVVVSRTIWEATLTVRDLTVGDLGCANGNVGNLNCTDSSTLSEDSFTYDGITYSVNAVKVVSGGKLRINFSTQLNAFAQNLIFHVGSETFDFEEADTEHSAIRYWLNSGLTWTEGDTVELKLEAPDASDVATLDDLEITDSDDNDISLDPAFVSGTAEYAASVDRVVDRITFTPTETDASAAVEYLDETDAALVDADLDTAGHQVDLSVGANTIKVRVTSTDLSETETYTVVVTRLADTTLVKNAHFARSFRRLGGNFTNGQIGQRFTTGSHADGYTVTSVGVHLHAVRFSGMETVTARIHEFNDSETNDLGTPVATLTTPATLTAGEVNFFTAPADTTLAAGTQYILNFHSTGDSANDLEYGITSADEQTGASGWLIENTLRSSGVTLGTEPLMIEVRGKTRDSAISTDATLSDLELEDSDANDIALDPAFDAATTSYTATVDEVVEVLTVTPTKNDDGATIEYLDGIARPLADADDETEEHQVSLDVGANTFKVKVTAEDGNETSTYIVTVTRLADNTLVKNTHLSQVRHRTGWHFPERTDRAALHNRQPHRRLLAGVCRRLYLQ